MDAATPPRTYFTIRYSSITSITPYTALSVMTENSSSPAVTPGDTAAAVYMNTPSTPVASGLGATTNGWRPSSVKIHPAMFAANGATMPSSASRMIHGDDGTVPLRVSHSATAPPNATIPPRPIISRKPQ